MRVYPSVQGAARIGRTSHCTLNSGVLLFLWFFSCSSTASERCAVEIMGMLAECYTHWMIL